MHIFIKEAIEGYRAVATAEILGKVPERESARQYKQSAMLGSASCHKKLAEGEINERTVALRSGAFLQYFQTIEDYEQGNGGHDVYRHVHRQGVRRFAKSELVGRKDPERVEERPDGSIGIKAPE